MSEVFTGYYLVTDFDRINGGMFDDRKTAAARAKQLAAEFPGNRVCVLETVSWYLKLPDADKDSRALSDLAALDGETM